MSSSSTLATEAVILVRARNPTKRTPCPPARSAPGDRYAQYHGTATCIDETGRKRRRHEYMVMTRAGTRCLWCWSVEKVGDEA